MHEPTIADIERYWSARPCNVRHSDVDIDADPVGYDLEVANRRYFVESHILEFAQFKGWRGKRVLDLGCGIGTDAITFAICGADVTAIDISPRSIEIARKRAGAYKRVGNVRFLCGDIEQLPRYVEPQRFDLVYSFGVLHHTPCPERVVVHLRDYMGPDSVLKLMLYNRYSWKAFWILATFGKLQFWRWAELIAQHSEAQEGCPITRTYTPRLARELLDGFAIEDMRVDHIFPYRIEDYIDHRYVMEWYWRVMPPAWFQQLEKLVGWHLLITARLKGEKGDHPILDPQKI